MFMRRRPIACAVLFVLAAFATAPNTHAQTPAPESELRFELGGGKAHTAKWFSRVPAEEVENTIQRVVTPVKVGSETRIEVYTNIDTNRKGTTIRRMAQKQVFNAADMRPISSRSDVEMYAGSAVQTAWREVKYEGNRVTGQSVDPRGAKESIDRELPTEAIVAPGIAFAFLHDDLVQPGRTLTFKTFNEAVDDLQDVVLKIVKREKVTVADADYDAWKLEIKTGRINATAYYTTTVPRVLLRMKDSQGFQELIEMSR